MSRNLPGSIEYSVGSVFKRTCRNIERTYVLVGKIDNLIYMVSAKPDHSYFREATDRRREWRTLILKEDKYSFIGNSGIVACCDFMIPVPENGFFDYYCIGKLDTEDCKKFIKEILASPSVEDIIKDHLENPT